MTVVSASFDAIPRLLLTLVTALMISSFNARFSRFAPASSFVNLAFPLDIRFLIISYSTNSIDFSNDKIDVLRKIVAMRERGRGGCVCKVIETRRNLFASSSSFFSLSRRETYDTFNEK